MSGRASAKRAKADADRKNFREFSSSFKLPGQPRAQPPQRVTARGGYRFSIRDAVDTVTKLCVQKTPHLGEGLASLQTFFRFGSPSDFSSIG